MHDLAKLHWNHVETPILVISWLICIVFAKLAFHKSPRMQKLFPESAVLIVLGLIAGYFIYEVWHIDLFLHPDLFFLYLLPPIVLDAGYFMPSSAFFANLPTITLYAVLGTVMNVVLIGMSIFAFNPIYGFDLNYVDVLLYSTLISAVDPVAVLSVFEEIHVNKLLYICVFGESLLNDAVTVVMYHSFHSMVKIGQAHLIYQDFTLSLMNFVLVSGGGVLIGLVFTGFTSLTVKWSADVHVLQPLICLTFPYLSYLVAEFVHVSGILAIVVCGLMMKPYVMGSMSEKADITVKYFLKTLSASCEAIIFVFLGFSIFSKNHQWDIAFALVTTMACIICRFIVVFFLTFIANMKRIQKIGLRDQIIMSFGGLRGAICFGLVLTLDNESVSSKPILISTTLVVIAVTVFIQGTLIKPLVMLLDVKTGEENHKTIFERVVTDSCDDAMSGIEAIIGSHGQHYWRERMQTFNTLYIEPALSKRKTNRGKKLVDKFTSATTEEQKETLLKQFKV